MAGESGRATFALDLESNAGSVAEDSASALERLRSKIEDDEAALKGLQAAFRRLKGDGSVAKETLDKTKAAITAQKASIGATTAEYLKLGGSFKAIKKPPVDANSVTLTEALLQRMPRLSSAIKSVGGASLLAAAGTIAFVSALAAAVAIAGTAIAVMARYALTVADARRSEGLRLEGLAKTRNLWAEMLGIVRKADTGDFLQKTVDRVAAGSALARDQVVGLTEDFYRAGLRAGNLQSAVEAGAIALSTQGQAGLDQFKALALNAQMFGGSVKRVADDVKARLGGIAERQMLSLNVQFAKLKENAATIFSGVKIEGILKAVKEVLSLFSQSTLAGQSLKRLAEAIFNPLFDSVAKNGLSVKRFFQGAIIMALQFALRLLDLRDAFRRVFGRDFGKNFDLVQAAFIAGSVAAGMFAGALAFAGAAATAAIAPFILLGYVAYQLIAKPFADAYDAIAKQDWVGLGASVVNGIFNGIMAMMSLPLTAMNLLGEKLGATFASKMQIHSPSVVMAGYGKQLPAGAAAGVEAGTPVAVNSMSDMAAAMADAPMQVKPTPVRRDLATGSNAKAQPTSQSFTFGDINLNGAKTDKPEDFADQFMAKLTTALQGVAINLGIPEPV